MIYEIVARRFMAGSNSWSLGLVDRETGKPVQAKEGDLLVDQVGRRFRVGSKPGFQALWLSTLVRAEDRAFDRGPSKDIISDVEQP